MQLIIDGGDVDKRSVSVTTRFPISTHAYIKPEKTKTVIAVKDIRELVDQLSISTPLPRVVWIEGAEALSPTSQNTLLKTLEEPPANTHFVLTLQNHRLLLPTILSRCELIHLESEHVIADQDLLKIVKTAMQEGLGGRLTTSVSLGKDRESLILWFQSLLSSLHTTLRTTTNGRSLQILSQITILATTAIDQLNSNGNITLVRDHFFISLPRTR